jgi:SAM-dependent methyltransferase
MTNAPAIHLAIIQPDGYVHSLGFLDQARYFRHMFRRQGATVTMGKNRLREDAVNFVFGAHLGFPADWQERHACIFVNLEQLGQGGAAVSPDYLALLRRSAVVDYDAANVAAYAQDPADVPVVPFGYAAYLDQPVPALEERPIDLLFFGSMNERRRHFIAQVEAAGFEVAAFDAPIYGPERDAYIRQAKAVLNCHFYESNRFEQARAFHCLSLGTPVISEYTPTTDPAPAFHDAVLWLPDQVEEWFRLHFKTPAFYEEAHKRLAAFRAGDAAHDPMDQYAELLTFASGFQQGFAQLRRPGPWRPRAINLGTGKHYMPTWLNIDTGARSEPDLVLDLCRPLALPHEASTRMGGSVRFEAGAVELVFTSHALESLPDLPMLMSNALALLKEGGAFCIELPCQAAPVARPDAPHKAVLDENAWLDYTDRFWRLGWFEHRFEIAASQWLDAGAQPCARDRAASVRVTLKKVTTSPRERTVARTMRADFGGVDADEMSAGSDAALA